jgi:YVTN family beta-propeller protein
MGDKGIGMGNTQGREVSDAAMGAPLGRVSLAVVWHRPAGRRARAAAGVLAVAGVAVTGVTAGAAPGPAAAHRPAAPTVYASYTTGISPRKDLAIPISTATNKAGKPIGVGVDGGQQIAITPDGKTAYVLNTAADTVVPVSTASNKAGTPIPVGRSRMGPWFIAITPDGKTAYVACNNAVIPISTATNTPGKPVPAPLKNPMNIAITP